MEEMVARGRKPAHLYPGEASAAARLTSEQVAEIRQRYGAGETQEALAAVFGMTRSAISYQIRGKVFPDSAYVPPPLGTRNDNPGYRGERHHRAALTDAQAQEIRRRYAQGLSQSAVAQEFGVSQITVSRVVRGERYA
jgi:DNA-binding transcriptional regulator YiaG